MNDDVISAVYDGPLGNPPWAATLPKLRQLTGTSRLMLKFSAVDPGDGGSIYTSSRSPEDDWTPNGPADIYRRFYQWKDPVRYGSMVRGEVRQLDDLIDRRTFNASAFYRELCRPLEIENAFFGYLGRIGSNNVWFNGSRSRAEGPFTEREIATVRRLLPHLSRAATIHSRMEQLQAGSAACAHSIGALGIGMILLDRQGDIVGLNAEAEAVLAATSAIRRTGDRLCLPGTAQPRLEAALKAVAKTGPDRSTSLIADDGSTPVNLVIRAAQDAGAPRHHTSIASIVYLSRGPRSLPARAADFISSTYGLSPAEARLSVLLADGHTLDDSAALLGVTPTTARTYCKRAFAKTGTTRQAELVRLVLGSLARLA